MSTLKLCLWLMMGGVSLAAAGQASAQVRLDRADPTIVEQALPRGPVRDERAPKPVVERPARADDRGPASTGMVTAVIVEGLGDLDPATFAPAYAAAIGHTLTRADLTDLAGRVAGVARRGGYPFATATIGAQSLANGILRVQIDAGRIDAVRVVGGRSAAADAILGRALVTGRPVRRRQLEQALALAGDVAGVRVTSSRYVKQEGFGILLVTIEVDRASAYAQVDNRGSREIGPIRATMLGNFRGVVQSGDELAFVAALTPVQPGEFMFLRGRYGAPVDRSGGIVSVSASYGRSHPGASLRRLDVIGRSTDVALAYARPLVRSRTQGLWANAELRALSIEQTLAGNPLRDDRLATLTGSVNGFGKVGAGVVRGEIGTTIGLPLAGATREGDRRTSRVDGDARFVTIGYTIDWTVRLAPPVELVLASSGQLASRPLLATMELGAGGPVFGRGYDYAERTGDNGILGSAEVRFDIARVVPRLPGRMQAYGFVDGGRVGNLRDGIGGGTVFSTGAGVRIGFGRTDAMLEAALPLNADRFDTGDRRPRFSLRLSRAF